MPGDGGVELTGVFGQLCGFSRAFRTQLAGITEREGLFPEAGDSPCGWQCRQAVLQQGARRAQQAVFNQFPGLLVAAVQNAGGLGEPAPDIGLKPGPGAAALKIMQGDHGDLAAQRLTVVLHLRIENIGWQQPVGGGQQRASVGSAVAGADQVEIQQPLVDITCAQAGAVHQHGVNGIVMARLQLLQQEAEGGIFGGIRA